MNDLFLRFKAHIRGNVAEINVSELSFVTEIYAFLGGNDSRITFYNYVFFLLILSHYFIVTLLCLCCKFFGNKK